MNLIKMISIATFFGFATMADSKELNKPSNEQLLYEQLIKLTEAQQAGGKALSVSVEDVHCKWKKPSVAHVCTYKNLKGESKTLKGQNATRLFAALDQVSGTDGDCGLGDCGFRNPVNATCTISKDGLDAVYECKVVEKSLVNAPLPPVRPADLPKVSK